MTDNIAITAGAGTNVATKDLSGAHIQKIVWVNEAGAFIAKAEDTAHTTGDFLVPAGFVRQDTAVSLAGADGEYLPGITDASGRLWVAIGNVPNVTVAGTPNVAVTSHVTQNVTLLSSAARTTAQTAAFTNEYHKGVLLIGDVSVDPATADITPSIQVQDPITLTWNTYWTAAAAISAVGQFKYLIYPGAATGAGVTEYANLPLPRTCRLSIAVADADSMTYSFAAVLLV